MPQKQFNATYIFDFHILQRESQRYKRKIYLQHYSLKIEYKYIESSGTMRGHNIPQKWIYTPN